VGGSVNITRQGTFSVYGPAYYLPTLGVILLSHLQIIIAGYYISFYNDLHLYTVSHQSHPTTIFTRNIDGLYTVPRASIPHLNNRVFNTTIPERKTTLSKREQLTVDTALSLHERFGHCGDDRLINIINSGKIINCPITAKQYIKARQHAGPCLHCLRGKLTQDHQHSITIDQYYPTEDNEDNIFADIFYLKGATTKTPYLLAVTAKTKHISVTALRSNTGVNTAQALSTLIKQHQSFGLIIKRVIADHEANFKATEKQLQLIGAQLIQNSPEMYSRQAE
jgi:hypothetical protein